MSRGLDEGDAIWERRGYKTVRCSISEGWLLFAGQTINLDKRDTTKDWTDSKREREREQYNNNMTDDLPVVCSVWSSRDTAGRIEKCAR